MSTAITQANFQTAVNAWIADPTAAEATYGHIRDWDTSAVTNMDWAFYNKDSFNDDISSWNVSNVTSMKGMFYTAVVFNTDISSWDVSAVTDMYYMFFYAREFNQNITNWNTTSVTDFTNMFNNATLMIANHGAPRTPDQSYFNQVGLTPITQANIQTAVDEWCYDPVVAEATYGHIRDWDTSSVTRMSNLFNNKTTFNDDISGWDVSNVTSMYNMFFRATVFNQDISGWDISSLEVMYGTFGYTDAFNQDISGWNTSNVTDMGQTFVFARAFNQDISGWDVSNVIYMQEMFFYATAFNQDITTWNTTSVTNFDNMFSNATLMIANQGAPVTPDQSYFNHGLTPITQANIQTAVDAWVADPTAEATYGHITDWDTSAVTDMSELFNEKWTFNDDISNWNTSAVTNMDGMFYGAGWYNQPVNSWDTSAVTSMSSVFDGASSFNQPLNSWDTSAVTNMFGMFHGAEAFNQDISGWDISAVTNMAGMLSDTPFNQPINSWNTSNVTDMQSMFHRANEFNQPLNSWNTSAVTNMNATFSDASSFNKDIKDWDVSNVTDMGDMFKRATVFSRDLSRWVVGSSVDVNDMFIDSPMGTGGDRAPTSDTPPLSYFNQAPCFNQDTLILCPTGNICVKDLKEGDKVVTTSGIKSILRIDSKTRQFNNTNNVSNTMYRMKKTGDMTHDLLVTGNHAILLDNAESYYHGRSELFPEDKKVDGKYPIIAGMYHKFEKETEPKEHTIYHIAIDGDQNRYGLFANGVLMESWDKRQTSM